MTCIRIVAVSFNSMLKRETNIEFEVKFTPVYFSQVMLHSNSLRPTENDASSES